MDLEQKNLFFSIVIPAHNEEKYIVSTLQFIKELVYPKDKLEVFVMENGSKDKTFLLAKKFESENLKVFSLEKNGVSHAKNEGIKLISEKSDWTVVLDADTFLMKDFLLSLNDFLLKKSSSTYSIGTTYVKPIPHSYKASLWFSFYDWGHRITKTSYSIQIVKTSILKKFTFNESISMGEDLELIAYARKFGKFFMFANEGVFTSTRRFENQGWFSLFIYWNFVASLPNSIKKRFSYKVIR